MVAAILGAGEKTNNVRGRRLSTASKADAALLGCKMSPEVLPSAYLMLKCQLYVVHFLRLCLLNLRTASPKASLNQSYGEPLFAKVQLCIDFLTGHQSIFNQSH